MMENLKSVLTLLIEQSKPIEATRLADPDVPMAKI